MIEDYLLGLYDQHRATRSKLLLEGKTYRSRLIAFENGYLNCLKDIEDYIRKPSRERELREALARVVKI